MNMDMGKAAEMMKVLWPGRTGQRKNLIGLSTPPY
jgi:hypothetical protein